MAKRPKYFIKSDRDRKIGVIDTNIFMNLVMFDEDEEFTQNKLLFQFLNQNDIDPTKIIQENYGDYSVPEIANLIKKAIFARNEKYRFTSRNLNQILYQHNMIPAITETIKNELLDNTSLERGLFDIDTDRLEDNKYVKKAVSRYFYERYETHIRSFIHGYQVLPKAVGEQSVINGMNFGRESKDAEIYDTCLFYDVYAIITNNVGDFKDVRSRIGKKRAQGKSVRILSPSFSRYNEPKDFADRQGTNESLATILTWKMNNLLWNF